MTPGLVTERLLLLPLVLADAVQVQEIFPQWEIVRFLDAGVPWPYPPGETLAYYSEVALPAVAMGKEWHWSLRLRSTPGRIIGAISLHRDGPDHRGFWLDPKERGRGLMTEAIAATNDFWFETLRFPVLRSSRAAANQASRRLAQKTGMRLAETGKKDFVSGRLTSEIWEITAEQWRAVRAAGFTLPATGMPVRPAEHAVRGALQPHSLRRPS